MTSITYYSGIRSRNLFTYIRGNRRPDGTCCATVPGINEVLISDPEGMKAWYDALYIQAERPYSVGGGKWGVALAYTLGSAEENGSGGTFSLDFPRVRDYPRTPTGSDERHRLVMTGIVGLPFDFIPTLPAVNANFGRPSGLIDPGRRLQVGIRYGF